MLTDYRGGWPAKIAAEFRTLDVLVARAGAVKAGAKRFPARPGGTARVTIKLSKPALRKLARARKLKLTLRLSYNRAVTQKTLLLHR